MFLSYVIDKPFHEVNPADFEKWCRDSLKRPSDFRYSGNDERMFKTMALGQIVLTRDSDTLVRSNFRVLKKQLETACPPHDFEKCGCTEADDPDGYGLWYLSATNHWAVGWVEHLSFVPFNSAGETTKVAAFIYDAFTYIREQHPVLDEDDYSALRCKEGEYDEDDDEDDDEEEADDYEEDE